MPMRQCTRCRGKKEENGTNFKPKGNSFNATCRKCSEKGIVKQNGSNRLGKENCAPLPGDLSSATASPATSPNYHEAFMSLAPIGWSDFLDTISSSANNIKTIEARVDMSDVTQVDRELGDLVASSIWEKIDLRFV